MARMSWNESWNEHHRTASAACAFRAFSRDIGAGSALRRCSGLLLIRGLEFDPLAPHLGKSGSRVAAMEPGVELSLSAASMVTQSDCRVAQGRARSRADGLRV
jgi:hypothetical protein